MNRETARRTRQALITTGATLGLIVTAVAALTDHTTTLVLGAALLIGCGIAQAIEEHLKQPTGPQVPLGAPERDREDWLPDAHHNQHHDEGI